MLMRSFQKMIEATITPVYKRLDAIECPLIANSYQPPPGATKWVDYEMGEVDPQYVDNVELEYADLDLQDAAATKEANCLSDIKHAYHILEAGQHKQLELAE